MQTDRQQVDTQRVPIDVPRELYNRMNKVIAYGSRTRVLTALIENYVNLAEKSLSNREILAALVIEGKVRFVCPTLDIVTEVENAVV